MLSMKYRTPAKSRSQEKTVLNYSSWLFLNENLPKTPSTVSKCSSEKHRTEFLPTTPSRKRNQKRREKECSSKYYGKEILTKTPLWIVIDKSVIEMLVKKYR